MGYWEKLGQSDEWYTPAYIFEALGETFDLDVATSALVRNVPTKAQIFTSSLESQWSGFIWMNPPFGGRNGLVPWLDKFFAHNNGIALTPDRTSALWWQTAAQRADAILFVSPKIKFEKPDGTAGNSPGTGTSLFAAGARAVTALKRANANGIGHLSQCKN